MGKFTALFLLYFSLFISSTYQYDADLVTDLPDYPFKGRFYSGYLDLKDNLKKYHYIFVEAAFDPSTAPLVLWLNGGPGCSSLMGWATENGPAVIPDFENEFKINNYSWHKLANMIYLESPGNVGFSYISSSLETELAVNDDIVAVENFQALQDWFKKYPTFKNNDFYITGESYAGIYIPRLAEKIVDYNAQVISSKRINFKGFAVGNGVASWKYDTTEALYDFAFTHGVCSYETRKEYIEYCFNNKDETKCTEIKTKIDSLTDGLNIYDLLQDCGSRTSNSYINMSTYYYKYARWAFPKRNTTPNKAKHFLAYIEDGTLEPVRLDPPCTQSEAPTKYFNRADIKNALHVNSTIEWAMCSDSVFNNYIRSDEASLYLYPKLIKAGLKILIFSGDTDMAVPYNGNMNWIDSLQLGVVKPWTKWRAYGDQTTIAGYRVVYNGLTFVTVKGTGHMVPQWKPKEAFYMMEKYFKDEDLC